MKAKELLPFVTTQMDFEGTIGEISQTGKDKYSRYYLYGESKKKGKLIETESKEVVSRGRMRRGTNREK